MNKTLNLIGNFKYLHLSHSNTEYIIHEKFQKRLKDIKKPEVLASGFFVLSNVFDVVWRFLVYVVV